MALWALTDNLAGAPKWLTPKFTFDGTDVTGGVFTIANHGIKNGDQITFANGSGTLGGINPATTWYAKVLSNNTFELYSNANLSSGKVTPSDTVGTGHSVQVTPSDIFFADSIEVQNANNIGRGFTTPGWYRYATRTTDNSEARTDIELLCAISAGGATGTFTGASDAEDTVLESGATLITIATQLADVTYDHGTSGNGNANFTIDVDCTDNGVVACQLQESTDGGTTFTNSGSAVNSSAGGSNVTLPVAIADTSKNGFKYRAVLTSALADTVTSAVKTLTVT